jgi:hypothetical protein
MGPKTRFHSLLEKRIQQAISDHSEAIIGGQVPDFATYRDSVGYIRGLNDALKLCDEINEDLDK